MESYEQLAHRTEARVTGEMRLKLAAPRNIRLLHAAFGLCTEAGEFHDQLKRHTFYSAELDETNLIEELGDLMWYVALAANVLAVSIEEIQEINIAKLKARFPEKFDEASAITRDLDVERDTLERAPAPTPNIPPAPETEVEAPRFIDLLVCTECGREEYFRQGGPLPDDWVQRNGTTLCPHCNYPDHDEDEDAPGGSNGVGIRISLDMKDFRTLVRGKVLECTLDSRTVQIPLQICLKDLGHGPMLETIQDAIRERTEG
jgi:NTP pyrophosphatase (non-canonical NTP hydrolase)